MTIGQRALGRQRKVRKTRSKYPPLVIGRDGNEVQLGHDGYLFEGYGVEVIDYPLETGDYTIVGMDGLVRIERKGLKDMVGSLGVNSPDFLDKADRLGMYRWSRILAEARYHQVAYPPNGIYPWLPMKGGKRRGPHPNSARGTLLSADIRGAPVIWVGTRSAGEWWLYHWFQKLWLKWCESEGK